MKLSLELCELVGIIIGDGNIYDKKPFYVEISGHPKDDMEYITLHVKKLVEKELNYSPRISVRSHAIRLRINKKKFVEKLKKIGIETGNKKRRNLLIPPSILKFKSKVKACIRGIFDTDASLYFDRRKCYISPYVRIELHMYCLKLLVQISKILHELGINSKISKKKQSLYINGYNNVKSFLKKIGLSNVKHLRRLSIFYPELLKFNCAPVAQLVEQPLRKDEERWAD